MKQSTKLLSLILALVMAFSCASVVGNAALVKSEVKYDSIDDAIISPEQVADIALDLVDDLLASGGDDMNIDLAGIITLDLRSVDTALRDICDLGLGTLLGFAGGILDLGALEDLDFGPLSTDGKSKGKPWQRSHGDLVVVRQLLQFLNNNAGVISPAVRGINVSGGLDLGMIGDFLGDMGEINDILQNLPTFVKEMVFDMLIHGSYNASYADESFPSAEELGSLPANVDTLAEIADYAIGSLLSNPQDYEWIDTDGDGIKETKKWDPKAKLLPTAAAYGFDFVADYFSVLGTDFNANNGVDATQNTIFQILDKAAPFAIYDLAIPALNHNLKKGLMEAVEADINSCDEKDVPAEVMAVFKNEAAYVTYIGYDCMAKSDDGEWFYSTLESETLLDANKNPVLDEDGNEQTHKVRKYFKVNMASANEFASLINWDWNLYAPVPLSGDITQDDINEINYEALIATYGTITESLNDIIGVVYQNALTEEVKADFADITGDAWITGATSEVFNYNIERLLKYLLANFADKIFGEDSAYADEDVYGYDFYEPMSLIDIVALIGPSFFEDVMPQLIIPQNEDGTYAFAESEDGESVAFLQFGSIVIREFMTEIAPNVNYDAFIFADGSLTDGSGRQFADHSAEEWFNIILNMGMDIAYTYLYQITNFGDNIDYDANGIALDTTKFSYRASDLPKAPASEAEATSEDRWKGMLNSAIEWAVNYVGQGSDGVLKGLNPNSVSAVSDPLDKLSYILNSLLPLGFINGLEDGTYDVSVSVLFDRLKVFLTKFDFNQLIALFGRNGVAEAGDDSTLVKGNILNQPVQGMAINLINNILGLVFQRNILATKDNNDATPTTLDGVIEHVALQRTVENIIRGLYGVQGPLLRAALPVVGKLIKGWGTEQNFSTPGMDISSHVKLTGGATSEAETVTISNKADGVWRSWVDASGTRYQDEQYQIKLTGVKALEFDGKTTASGVSFAELDTTNYIPYGKEGTFKFSVSGVNSNKFVRIDVSYQVYEGTKLMTNDTYVMSSYVYLDNTTTDEATSEVNALDNNGTYFGTKSPQYVDLSGDIFSQLQDKNMVYIRSKNDQRVYDIVVTGPTVDGITPGTASFCDENFLGKNTQRDWDPLKIYTDGDYNSSNDDKPLRVAGASFNKQAFADAGKVSGSTSTLSFTFTGYREKVQYGDDQINYNATGKATVKYYDGAAQNELAGDVRNELQRGRVSTDYLSSGVSYADTLLNFTTYTDEDGEEVTKNTNFSDSEWVNSDGEVVTGVTPSAEDENVGTYKVGNVTYTAKKVTKIDNSKVWSNYITALNAAADAAYSAYRSGGNFDYEGAIIALNAAVTDLNYAEADVVANPEVSTAIDNLKTKLDSVENTYTDNYDYTDYKMYRLNRLNDAREDARWLVDLKKDAAYKMADIDSNFPYNGMTEADLKAIVAANPSKLNLVSGTDKANIVVALLEDLSDEDYASREQWLEDRQLEFAGLTTFDVAYASDMLTKTSSRLLNRTYKVNGDPDFTMINTEIASAEAEIDADNRDDAGNKIYTDRSWAKYTAALQTAKDVVAGANGQVKSQKNAFDAKWELLCCRNELVLVENEADYSELEALIAQAEQVMANLSLYDNTAKELGQVLAELGVKDLVNADGDNVDIFPGSAYHVNAEPYAVEDQDKIDGKATELKEALARLKFYNLSITGDVAVADKTIIAADKEAGIEAVIAKIATISPAMKADDVKKIFTVGATGATVSKENITVSNDLNYTIETGLAGFAGTNSVVTFYTVKGDIKIPVATVKLVVNGDINGDGVVDVIDGANAFLVSTDKAALEGCYFIAGNLAGEAEVGKGVIDADDYSALINLVVA